MARQRFHVGQSVRVNGYRAYDRQMGQVIGTGMITDVRHRYAGQPQEYYQYYVQMNGEPPPNNATETLFEEWVLSPLPDDASVNDWYDN